MQYELKLLKKSNFALLTTTLVMGIFTVYGAYLEYTKEMRTLPFVFLYFILFLLPIIISAFLYKKDILVNHIRNIVIIPFMVAYTISVFTNPHTIIFIFAFPILAVTTLYNNKIYTLEFGLAIFSVNMMYMAAIFMQQGLLSDDDLITFLIRGLSIACFVQVCIMVVFINEKLKKDSNIFIEEIKVKKQQQEKIISDITNVYDVFNINCTNAYDKSSNILSGSKQVSLAVKDIATGINNIVENVQKQTEDSFNIQQQIENTANLFDEVTNVSVANKEVLKEGTITIHDVSDKSNLIKQTNESVLCIVKKLENQSNNIAEVVYIIRDIAEQTNLLALNASIEAARAGDYGRGFAVVADEVKKLAEQSKQSANSIGNTISELQKEISETVQSVNVLSCVNNEQNELISNTKIILDKLDVNTEQMQHKIEDVNHKISDILIFNSNIVKSITNISSVTEECLSNTKSAEQLTINNESDSHLVTESLNELVLVSKQLGKYIEGDEI